MMADLRTELEAARNLEIGAIADAVESIGFSCTRCGACCRGHDTDHTATVFPDEVRDLQDGGPAGSLDWRDVARPMPFGLSAEDDGSATGETFEWALQTDECGDCAFYADDTANAGGTCTVYPARPLICRTYPFSVELGGSEPLGAVVDRAGPVRAHECEGLGREIERDDAEALARTLKKRAIRELEELIAVRDEHEPARDRSERIVVHDSEGAKRPDGTPID